MLGGKTCNFVCSEQFKLMNAVMLDEETEKPSDPPTLVTPETKTSSCTINVCSITCNKVAAENLLALISDLLLVVEQPLITAN